MNDKDLLNCRRLPAIITAEEVLRLTGFTTLDQLRILMRHGLLPPLGKPAPNGQKLFSSSEVLALAQNRDWAERAVRTISRSVQAKNRNPERTARACAA
jgi:hypothetical protein